MTQMLKSSSKARRILLPLFSCFCILLLWQFSVSHRWISPLSLAAPGLIQRRVGQAAQDTGLIQRSLAMPDQVDHSTAE